MEGRPAVAPFGMAVAACLVAGAFACARLPALPHWLLLLPMLVSGGALWWRRGDWKRPLGAALVGFALFGLHATSVLSRQLPPAHERGDASVTGRVVQLPAQDAAQIEQHLAQLRQAGIAPEEVEIRRADLEDVFLQVMNTAPGARA